MTDPTEQPEPLDQDLHDERPEAQDEDEDYDQQAEDEDAIDVD